MASILYHFKAACETIAFELFYAWGYICIGAQKFSNLKVKLHMFWRKPY
jgi:hypothetical protein